MFRKPGTSDDWHGRSAEELWTAFQSGNRGAFSELFLRYYEQLFRYGMNFSSGSEVVKDSIQKLFFRLWQKRTLLSRPRSVRGYLFVSLRRILLRLHERETSRGERNARYLEQEDEAFVTIEEEIVREEQRKRRMELYRKSVEVLSPRQKEALLLRVDEGMSNGEIAKIMGISDKRVRNLIYEATRRIREEIYYLTE
ncbi:RNA polymerase sigma factor [Halalkalibaculum sp. DA3122]